MLHITIKYLNFKLLVTILSAFSMLMGACSSPTPAPTATPEPTAIPAPTAAPQTFLESLSQEELVGETWQWVGLRETTPAAQSVIPDPENYTLTFKDDGTVSIKADCIVAMGSYQLSGDQMTIDIEPTIQMDCGPESVYNQFLTSVGQASGVGLGYG
ncbi:MAG: META domain-containing protein, partial [Anaerolineales bacterium]